MSLKDKVTVVTGAGAGIGKGIASKFAAQGAKLVINDINAEDGLKAVEEIRAAGGIAEFVQGDTSNPSDVNELIKFTTDTYGALDVLINNAGIEKVSPFHLQTKEQWDRVININLTGVFLVAQGAVKEMMANGGGVVINIASVAGLKALPLLSAYTASKHGVVGLTKTMALELRAHNIRVNAICPAFTQTPLVDRLNDKLKEAGLPVEDLVANAQVRVGTVEEVAELAFFLASEESSFINGAAIPIDNGYCA